MPETVVAQEISVLTVFHYFALFSLSCARDVHAAHHLAGGSHSSLDYRAPVGFGV